jgi:cytosine/adenosine deaminase-related metal-dependent hydrolase
MDPRIVPPEQGLEMGTINGARSLLWNDQIGSLEAGKKADMILFDTSRLDWLPMIDPVRNLVYSADGHSIDTTIIDGKVVVENGRAKFVSEKELTDQAQQRMTTILKKGGVKAVHAWPIV